LNVHISYARGNKLSLPSQHISSRYISFQLFYNKLLLLLKITCHIVTETFLLTNNTSLILIPSNWRILIQNFEMLENLLASFESVFSFFFIVIFFIIILVWFKSRDTVMSRAKFTCSAKQTVYLYARLKVETSRDYQISITVEPIELIISSIDSAYPNYILKVCLFLLYMM